MEKGGYIVDLAEKYQGKGENLAYRRLASSGGLAALEENSHSSCNIMNIIAMQHKVMQHRIIISCKY